MPSTPGKPASSGLSSRTGTTQPNPEKPARSGLAAKMAAPRGGLLFATPPAHGLECEDWFNPIIEQPLRIAEGGGGRAILDGMRLQSHIITQGRDRAPARA